MPVVDGEPGSEVQVDFGRGLIPYRVRSTRCVVHGLIFTAVYSRHSFVCPTYLQTLGEVIAGFEADLGVLRRCLRGGDPPTT